ncbi:MAG: hypothetical protein JNK65_05570 [Deltaproteobacteria bacterium]|nr:hypothetical protein [Deltaproteobacteria bacterium]
MTNHVQFTRTTQNRLLGLAQQAVQTESSHRSSELFRDVHAYLSLARSSSEGENARAMLETARQRLHLLSERSEAHSWGVEGLQSMFREASEQVQRRFPSVQAPITRSTSLQNHRQTQPERRFEQSMRQALQHYQSSLQHGRLATRSNDGSQMFAETQQSVREASQARRSALQAMRQAHQIQNPQIRSAAIARVTLLLSDLRTAEASQIEGMVRHLRRA